MILRPWLVKWGANIGIVGAGAWALVWILHPLVPSYFRGGPLAGWPDGFALAMLLVGVGLFAAGLEGPRRLSWAALGCVAGILGLAMLFPALAWNQRWLLDATAVLLVAGQVGMCLALGRAVALPIALLLALGGFGEHLGLTMSQTLLVTGHLAFAALLAWTFWPKQAPWPIQWRAQA